MKTETIRGIMADFLDSIRAYEHESGEAIHFDERESSEFVDMYFNNAKQEGIELTEKLINIIMKKYRLKQWYPSLQKKTIEGNIANWDADEKAYTVIQNGDRVEILDKTEVENNPDFWELIEEEKPLFTTEDGIKITEHRTAIILVDADFMKQYKPAIDCNINTVVATAKLFFHESNADEYIWKNKPIFSYNDIKKLQSGGEGVFYDVVAIAKERSEE